MENRKRLAPYLYSVLTAFIHSFILSGIYLSYPASEVLIKSGLINADTHWVAIPLSFSVLISIYTAIPKQKFLMRNNAIIIFLLCAMIYFVCAVYHLQSVKGQLGMLLYFSFYTVGLPLYAPVFSHLLHHSSNQLAVLKSSTADNHATSIISDNESTEKNLTLDSAFVGSKHADYYSNKFEYFDSTRNILTWHWPAFFLTLPWLLYRKMWVQAFNFLFVLPIMITLLVFALNSLFNFGFGVTGFISPTLASCLSIGIPSLVIAPLFANWLYYRHVRKNISLIKNSSPRHDQQISQTTKLGGTSIVPMLAVSMSIGSIILFYLYSVIDSVIKMKAYTSLLM